MKSIQRRNVEVSLSYHIIVVTLEEHMHSHSEKNLSAALNAAKRSAAIEFGAF